MGGENRPFDYYNMSDYQQLADKPVGQQIHSIYTSRLRQFTDGGQYYHQGLMRSVLITI